MSQAQEQKNYPNPQILTPDIIDNMKRSISEVFERIKKIYDTEVREEDKKRIIRDIAVHVLGMDSEYVMWNERKGVAYVCKDDWKIEAFHKYMLAALLYQKGVAWITFSICAKTAKLKETNEELLEEDEEIVNELRRLFNRPVFARYDDDNDSIVIAKVPIYEDTIHDIPVTIYFRIRFSRYSDP